MFFRRIKTPGLAHVAYVIGDGGEAMVVDPRRDIDEYLGVAREQSLTITHVVETHRQEDFVVGAAELARVTGAKIVTGRHELFGRGDIRLGDGEELSLAGLRMRALHTPGHTPESTCYALFLREAPDVAWAVLTGDTLFVGETGRTDLPDPLKTGENAGRLYDGVHQKLLPLGDQALVLPAHGSGSVCGGNIADRDESTLGIERRTNAVFNSSRAAFVAAKIRERIPRPYYFSLMEELNLKGGIPLARDPRDIALVRPEELEAVMGRAIVIDAREPEAFAAAHIPRSYSIWAAGLSVFAGWIAGPTTPIYLVLPSMAEAEEAVLSLARVGCDRVEGILAGGFGAWRKAGRSLAHSGAIGPRELKQNGGKLRTLDVRDDAEVENGHVPGASHMYVGYLERHLDRIAPRLDRNQPLAVTCSVGHRASLAVSILQRHGFDRTHNLLGGMTAWAKLDLPRDKGPADGPSTFDIEGERR